MTFASWFCPDRICIQFFSSILISPLIMISFGLSSADYTAVQDYLPVLKFWPFYGNIITERGKIFDNSSKSFLFLYCFIYASSIAFPMSWRIYLLSNFTHFVASYAFLRASFMTIKPFFVSSTPKIIFSKTLKISTSLKC